jgi:crotonobetainyl-CoA:carnitine CoA-transferase CaiB-like acyl-CoA transferase
MSDTQSESPPKGPLSGLKVLDFSRILSGPYASMVLADLGAEVIKIEPLDTGDETRNFPPFKGSLSHYYIALNRSKKSLGLNLKSARGVEIAKQLASQSDIVLENFRPGVMDRLGLGYDVLSADNPRLIFASISGFGSDSPLGNMPAFDIVAQALSGVMSINAEPGGPPNKLGLPLGDLAGSIFSVFGILAALQGRNQTGRGQRVEVAMLDSLIAMLGYLGQIYLVTGEAPQAVGTRHPSIVPYGAFPTKDGHVIVACLTEGFWQKLAKCLGMENLITDARFSLFQARLDNRDELEPLICKRMQQETTDYWLERLGEFDVPNARILDVAEALEQAHVTTRGLIETVTHPVVGDMKIVKSPIRFDGHGPAPAQAPSLLNEDTDEVLSSCLGYDSETLEQLAQEGVIASFG